MRANLEFDEPDLKTLIIAAGTSFPITALSPCFPIRALTASASAVPCQRP